MTVLDTRVHSGASRAPRTRQYVMCRPEHFAVEYAINPWMDPTVPVDRQTALLQWEVLHQTYLSLGHQVDLLPPLPGQPDMVFAANGAITVGNRTYGARFRYPERVAEAAAHAAFLRSLGLDVVEPQHVNEGEGDFLALGSVILAGTGFRTSIEAHIEAADVLDRPVVTLDLVNPRFYHLDTALAVLDDGNGDAPADIAYVPSAFSADSERTLRELFPNALRVPESEARHLALNVVSDGQNVIVPAQATRLANVLADRGYTPVPVDLSELLKAGGSVKCCTMERHA